VRSYGVSFHFRLTVSALTCRQHTSAYVSIRQHTSAYVSIRQHTSAAKASALSFASLCPRSLTATYEASTHTAMRPQRMPPAYVSIRQHTSAYVSIRQHTAMRPQHMPPAYVSIRQHTSAYVTHTAMRPLHILRGLETYYYEPLKHTSTRPKDTQR
jgi:hypothetical protein